MSELPVGWASTSLGEISESEVDKRGPDPSGETFRYVDISSIDRTTKRIVDPALLPTTAAPSRARQNLSAGDVLVSMTRPNLNAVAKVPSELGGSIGSTGFHVLRARLVSSDWLYYRVQAPDFISAMSMRVQGALYPAVRPSDIAQFVTNLPPRQEQDRIVAEIDKQFTRLDAATAALKRVQANLKRYRASVLKAACEGRLVPTEAELARKEGRDYEPADQLLQRILRERRTRWEADTLAKMIASGKPPKDDRWKDKYQEPAGPDIKSPRVLPEGWHWVSLRQLLREPLRNGHSALASKDGTGIRTLTLSAVTEGDFSERNTKLTTAPPERVAGLWLEPGDLLIERSNTPLLVGTARAYRGHRNYAIFPDLLIRVRVVSEIDIDYLEAWLRTETTRQYFQNSAQGISGTMPKIDQSVVENVAVPLPPRAEQSRIAAALAAAESGCDRIESSLDAKRKYSSKLRQSVLNAAFSGLLVKQSPSEEPASILLERIRQESAPAARPKSHRSRKEPVQI